MDWVDRLRQAVDAKGKHNLVAADAGIHPSTLSAILNRTASPQLETIVDLCRVTDVTVGWLLDERGHELSESDFEQLAAMRDWTTFKLDERDRRDRGKSPAHAPALPAVATPRGETWADRDEVGDREIPREYKNQGANAVFVTRGDSMIDAGIIDGDFLFVRKTRNRRVANRHVVVCRLDGTFTVKRLVVENDAISLISEKHGEQPVMINEDAERFELIGIVVGVSRDLLSRR